MKTHLITIDLIMLRDMLSNTEYIVVNGEDDFLIQGLKANTGRPISYKGNVQFLPEWCRNNAIEMRRCKLTMDFEEQWKLGTQICP